MLIQPLPPKRKFLSLEVFNTMVAQMPKYQFHITEGPQTQEVLVGVKIGFTAFFTQKIKFKSGNLYLRPGALLTLTIDGKYYSILFLNTKTSSKRSALASATTSSARHSNSRRSWINSPAAKPKRISSSGRLEH